MTTVAAASPVMWLHTVTVRCHGPQKTSRRHIIRLPCAHAKAVARLNTALGLFSAAHGRPVSNQKRAAACRGTAALVISMDRIKRIAGHFLPVGGAKVRLYAVWNMHAPVSTCCGSSNSSRLKGRLFQCVVGCRLVHACADSRGTSLACCCCYCYCC
jgi:hypothetical protein